MTSERGPRKRQKGQQQGRRFIQQNNGGVDRAGGQPNEGAEGTRVRLLTEGAKLFAKKGYDGTSVKELCDAAGVNVSLISYHFGGKEGIYRECLQKLGEETLQNTQRILQPPQSFSEYEVRLTMFVQFLLDLFVREPDRSQMAFKEADLETEIVRDIFAKSFLEIYKTIISFFAAAKNNEILNSPIDPETTTSLFFGSLTHFARMDKLASKYFGRSIADPRVRERVVQHFKVFYIDSLKKT